MNCERCEQPFGLRDLTFKKIGLVPRTTITRYEALCGECVKIVPIDRTSREPGEDDE